MLTFSSLLSILAKILSYINSSCDGHMYQPYMEHQLSTLVIFCVMNAHTNLKFTTYCFSDVTVSHDHIHVTFLSD